MTIDEDRLSQKISLRNTVLNVEIRSLATFMETAKRLKADLPWHSFYISQVTVKNIYDYEPDLDEFTRVLASLGVMDLTINNGISFL